MHNYLNVILYLAAFVATKFKVTLKLHLNTAQNKLETQKKLT